MIFKKYYIYIYLFVLVQFLSSSDTIFNNKYISLHNNAFREYIYYSNTDKYNSRISYIPRKSCGLGNKILGLISSIAYGVSYSCSLKVLKWDSLWWYFSFPLKSKKCNVKFNLTFFGHFYAIEKVIDNNKTRNYLIKNGIVSYHQNLNVMMNEFAYKISNAFLIISNNVKKYIKYDYLNNFNYGVHIRTGKADGKEYLLHYLKEDDIYNILKYIKNVKTNKSIYISSDSYSVKRLYHNIFSNIYYINTSNCNSGYGLMKENDRCAIEAIIDYYILSNCKYLILTRCSSFSLVSLFANRIGHYNTKKYKYFGKCNLHNSLFE